MSSVPPCCTGCTRSSRSSPLLFQRGGPLSAVSAILAAGAAIMAAAGIIGFGERPTPPRVIGIALSVIGLYLVR